MATSIDPRRRAAIDALLNAGWADSEDVASRMADVVINAINKIGWDAHVDSALTVFTDPTTADVVTLYDSRDKQHDPEDPYSRPYGGIIDPDTVSAGEVMRTHPYTVSGEFNRMLDHEVTEGTVQRLIAESGEESGNYIVEHYLIRDKRWSHIRFDSESGNFFAYAKTREEAQELLDYIVGLTWTMPKDADEDTP